MFPAVVFGIRLVPLAWHIYIVSALVRNPHEQRNAEDEAESEDEETSAPFCRHDSLKVARFCSKASVTCSIKISVVFSAKQPLNT